MTSGVAALHAQSVRDGFPLVPWCNACGRGHFHPRYACPHCGAADLSVAAPGPFEVRSFTWVMRPQAEAFAGRVPILMIAAHWAGANVIAEGEGWTVQEPPRIGEPACLTAVTREDGVRVAVFAPPEGSRR